jgi:hypothetical protein
MPQYRLLRRCRQEFDAKVGTDQLAIEATPWGDGDLRLNGAEVAHVHDEKTKLQAFQDLKRVAQTIPDKETRRSESHDH